MSDAKELSAEQDEIDPSRVSFFCKYCGDDERVIKGIFEDHKIRFTQPWAMNDPVESNPSITFRSKDKYCWFSYEQVLLPSEEWWVRFRLIERRINAFGILSLTKVHDSFDMWSRYANGHKGFLLCLKGNFNEHPCMLSREGKPYPVKRVKYRSELVIDMERLVDEQGNLRERLAQEWLFFRKLSRWKSEREYRMVRPFSDLPNYRPVKNKPHRDTRCKSLLFGFSIDCVELAVFGAYMSRENKARIKRACDSSGIRCFQAIIIRDEREAKRGKMGRVKMFPLDRFPELMDMQPFTFIMDTAHFNDQQRIVEIDSLSRLPYWPDDPEWVQELFDNRRKRERNDS
jgi:hypothetical protein